MVSRRKAPKAPKQIVTFTFPAIRQHDPSISYATTVSALPPDAAGGKVEVQIRKTRSSDLASYSKRASSIQRQREHHTRPLYLPMNVYATIYVDFGDGWGGSKRHFDKDMQLHVYHHDLFLLTTTFPLPPPTLSIYPP